MAWVEEAIGRGIAANRAAETQRVAQDRARQNQDLGRMQAQARDEAELKLAKQRELTWLEGLLQTLGVADLLADIQGAVGGGDIIPGSGTYFGWKNTSWNIWTALGFVKSEVNQTTHERLKGRKITTVKLSRIAVGAANIKSGDIHRVGFYIKSGTGTGTLTEQVVYSRFEGLENKPMPLKLLSNVPLVVKRELSFVHLGDNGDQPLPATHYDNEAAHWLFSNGRINPRSFDLSPNTGISTPIMNLADSVADRARLKELLGEELRRIV